MARKTSPQSNNRVPAPKAAAKKSRRIAFGAIPSFRLRTKADKPKVPKLTGTWPLLKSSLAFVVDNWKILTVLSVVYLAAYQFFVQGLQLFESTGQDTSTEESLFNVAASISTASSSANTPSAQSSALGGILGLLFALAVVWVVRKRTKGVVIRARDALYNSAGPLIPVLAILGILFVQLLPMALGIFLYVIATLGGVAASGVENMAVFVVALLAVTLSCYWVSSSSIALVVATVPGMYPWAAVRAAKELVSYRRWHVFLRILCLAIILALVWTVAIILVAVLTNSHQLLVGFCIAVVASILQVLTVIVASVFMYKLYRTLVDETAE